MPPTDHEFPHQHIVHFYERDADLTGMLTAFVDEGLERGEQVVLLATEPHWSAVRRRLSFAARKELKRGRIVVADADEMLERITSGGVADPLRFRAVVGDGLARVRRPVRIFGEVAGLIAGRGELEAAVKIEQLGQQLAHDWGAHVACAYHLQHLAGAREGAKQIAACHDLYVGHTI